MLTNQSIGYMDALVPKDINLKEAIDKLRKEKNAVILAHYYQTGDIQDIADYVGAWHWLSGRLKQRRISLFFAVFISWVKRRRFFVRIRRYWFPT